MKAIVVVDKHWGIGRQNDLLFRLPPDMARFKALTMGKVVVMGGNTLRSLPNGKPLAGRKNIVLSKSVPAGDYILVNGIEELKKTLSQFDTNEIFIIGGATFYRTMLPYCSEVLVTKVDADGNADVYFENLDSNLNFEVIETGKEQSYGELKFKFVTYKNRSVAKF